MMPAAPVPCPHFIACSFFHQAAMSAVTALVLKERYCWGASGGCARRLVSETLGPGAVPGDLYPDQRHRALAIVARSGAPPVRRRA